ncbi:MAG: alkaline phosphatase family protein, partial [Candidatus Thorarchaeota archaeon]
MEKNKKRLTTIFLITISIIFIFYLIIPVEKMPQLKYNKILVIGIDGMDPKISNKLMAEGKLPNFRGLAETGSFMNLNTSYPPHSPVAWTTIATGTNPGKHNIFDFIRINQKNYMPELSLSKSVSGISGTDYESYVKSDPFWRITTKAKIPTTVIRWPVTFPPERIEGNMLSGLGVPDIKGFLSGYTLYTSKSADKSFKSSNRIIQVKENNGIIETEIFGPKVKKQNQVIDIKAPMQMKISKNSAEIIVQDKTYNIKINGWSDWIRAEFKVGIIKKVSGIFKAYLVSINPFEMYITAIKIDPENTV